MSAPRAVLSVITLCLLASSYAFGDLVHLRNGRILRGEVIEEGKEFIVLRVPYGQLKLSMATIEYIERQSELEYRLDVGRDFLDQKRYLPAISQLENALNERKDSEEARRTLAGAYALYAGHLYQVRRLGEAKKYFEYLLKLDPQAQEGLEGLAAIGEDEGELDELIRDARASMAGRDLTAAIQKFEKVLQFSGDVRASIGPDLAKCHAYQGEFLYRSQKFDLATSALEKAFEYDPILADRLEDLYIASALSMILIKSNAGAPQEARKDLQRILTFAPTNKTALYIGGRLEQALQEGAKAAAMFARGLDTRVGAYTPERMARLRVDLEDLLGIPDGGKRIRFSIDPMDVALYAKSDPGAFEVAETDHFKIQHHNKELAEEVGRVLEAHHRRIADITRLEKEWDEKATVYLHRTQEEYSVLTAQPAWTGGMSRFQHKPGSGILKMQIHTWQSSPKLFKSVLPHEVAHLIVNTHLRSYDDLPRAIHEGLAVYMEPSFRHAYYINFLRERIRSKQFIPLKELLVMQDYPQDQEFFYAEGFALVFYLADLKGQEEMLKLVREEGLREDIEARILQICGARSIDALEKDWEAWLLQDDREDLK